MDDVVLMQVLETKQGLACETAGDVVGERAELMESIVHATTRHVLDEDGECVADSVGAKVVDDVGVMQRLHQPDLTLKVLELLSEYFFGGLSVNGERLHGHELTCLVVEAEVHRPERPSPQLLALLPRDTRFCGGGSALHHERILLQRRELKRREKCEEGRNAFLVSLLVQLGELVVVEIETICFCEFCERDGECGKEVVDVIISKVENF
mmetsp:Transcript_24213/g.57381  ORF Transcript_24213/g.57381 Transcript_24213/m.57381 type:complete len:210 (+) Transcript_24213:567-1196(+)